MEGAQIIFSIVLHQQAKEHAMLPINIGLIVINFIRLPLNLAQGKLVCFIKTDVTADLYGLWSDGMRGRGLLVAN